MPDFVTRADLRREMDALVRSPAFSSTMTPAGVAGRNVSTPEVADLPPAPQHGDEILFNVSDATCFWNLRFNQFLNPPYQWVMLGGAAMRATKADSDTFTSSSYADGSPVGPTLTVPLAGIYSVRWGARMAHDTGGGFGYMTIKIGSATTTDADGLLFQTAANFNQMSSFSKNFTVPAPRTVVKAQYKNGSGVGNFTLHNADAADNAEAFIEITPIFVGRV